MGKRKTIVKITALMMGLVMALYLQGCSFLSVDAPVLKVGNLELKLDDSEIGPFLQEGYILKDGSGKNRQTYQGDSPIASKTIITDLELKKGETVLLTNLDLKNDVKAASTLAKCNAFSYTLWKHTLVNDQTLMDNITLEGVPFFTAKPADLLPGLEKKFGKENIIVTKFKAEDDEVVKRQKDQGIQIDDVTSRTYMILFTNKKDLQWSMTFDLQTQTAQSLSMQKTLPMAAAK